MGAKATAVKCQTISKLRRMRSGKGNAPGRRPPPPPPDSLCGGLGRGLFIGCVGVPGCFRGAATIARRQYVPRAERHRDGQGDKRPPRLGGPTIAPNTSVGSSKQARANEKPSRRQAAGARALDLLHALTASQPSRLPACCCVSRYFKASCWLAKLIDSSCDCPPVSWIVRSSRSVWPSRSMATTIV